MLVIVLCSLLFEATTAHELGFRGKREPRPPTAVGADCVREEAATLQPTTVQATDLGMRQSGILNKSRPHVDSIESIVSGRRLCRSLSILQIMPNLHGPTSSGVLCIWVKQPWRQTYMPRGRP